MSNIEEMKNVLDDGVKEIWWFCLTELLIVYQKCSRLLFLSVNLSLTQWSSDLSAFQHKVTFFWAELGLNGVVMLFLELRLCYAAVCLTWSLSSVCPRSLPLAWAILFPDTRFPTITEAGPISATHRHNQHINNYNYPQGYHLKTLSRPSPTWLFLPRFGQVGDTGVGAHQDIAGVKPPLQVQLLDLRQVDAAQRSLGKGVGRHQSQTEDAHPVDAVYGLRVMREFGQTADGI